MKTKLYMLVVCGIYPIIDPETKITFTPGSPVETELTSWVKGQVMAKNLRDANPDEIEFSAQRAVEQLEIAEAELANRNAAVEAGLAANGATALTTANADELAVANAQQAVADSTASGSTSNVAHDLKLGTDEGAAAAAAAASTSFSGKKR